MGAQEFANCAHRNGAQDGFRTTFENGVQYSRPAYRESTAEEAFENLADNDRYENGHMYSGGIGMKHGFRVVTTVDTLKEARDMAQRELDEGESQYCDKWEQNAACIVIRQGDVGFLFWGAAPS